MRNFSRNVISYFLLATLFAFIGCSHSNSSSEYHLFVGTYTHGPSDGIYIYSFDAATGNIDSVGAKTDVKNPSFLATSPDQGNLYAVNEMADSARASVSSFAIGESGNLTFLNKQSSRGASPCYIAVDNNGDTIFVSNYMGGSFTLIPVMENGSLGSPAATVQHYGSSVNTARQQNPHVHSTILSPDENKLLVTDLGIDKVIGYDYDSQNTNLQQKPSFTYKTEAGAGPRHLRFAPNGRYAYLITEITGQVVAFNYKDSRLNRIQTVSNTPQGFQDNADGAEIQISPDGKFLYASNRGKLNNIVVYKINQDSGKLKKLEAHSSSGIDPRHFMIDPTGQYLLAANGKTNNIVIFKRNLETGRLSETVNEVNVPQPVYLKMIPKK